MRMWAEIGALTLRRDRVCRRWVPSAAGDRERPLAEPHGMPRRRSRHTPHWWSWSDVVQNVGRRGVPNFQRGAVWEASNRTALLESMYEQSPCGSFVFWEPESDGDPLRHGVPLRVFADGAEPLWIVDGQQRMRAMLTVFEQLFAGSVAQPGWSLVRPDDLESLRSIARATVLDLQDDEEDDAGDVVDGDGTRFWGVVLPAMRVFERPTGALFGARSESRNVQRGSMFRRLSPMARVRYNARGKETGAPPLPVGVVPLASLVAPSSVFHDAELRAEAHGALTTFATPGFAADVLDALIPWGPQFVTGHAYAHPALDGRSPVPLRWDDVHARRDASREFMVMALASLFTAEWRPVIERFRDMLQGARFAVGWLPPSDVSAAIDAYVRINRAGVRVRAEERALALLSRAHPSLLDDLAAFVRLRDANGAVEDQRTLLEHESDRHMGFSVWMTTVTRYTALSLMGTPASRWLHTSALDKSDFGYRLDRVGPGETDVGRRGWARPGFATPGEVVSESAARATRALVLLDGILCEELSFDHRMARPATRALTPMVDLLYRVPDHALEGFLDDRAFRAAVARIVHWTLLSPYLDSADMSQLVVDIHDVGGSPGADSVFTMPTWEVGGPSLRDQVRMALGRYQKSLLRIWLRKRTGVVAGSGQDPDTMSAGAIQAALTELAVMELRTELQNARSLQHPIVGWLYAIERRGGAKEFDWQVQIEGYQRSGGREGVPAPPAAGVVAASLATTDGPESAGLQPEKQHIVPFSIARQVTGKSGTRATASPANAIGNLTWLSQRQNGLSALSDRWTVMDLERDAANLAARGMLMRDGQSGVRTALEHYTALRDLVLQDRWRLEQERAFEFFEAFCDLRRRWMVKEMRAWLEEPLADATGWWLWSDSRDQ